MRRREFLAAASALTTSAWLGYQPSAAATRETFYNGIELPSPWPPRIEALPTEPLLPPYLKSPPSVIPIDVGRQLFVDDFLIEQTTLKRTFHVPRPHPDNPLVWPDKPWEKRGRGPMAMVFSDGVWFDHKDKLFKMWYMGGYAASTCYAVSEDGIRWAKPDLDVQKGTNIVQPGGRDSTTVWLSPEPNNPGQRFVLFRSHSEAGRWGLSVHFSADGVHWSDRVLRTGPVGDRTTVFWNPFRKKWIYSLRHGGSGPRRRRYWEVQDLLTGPQWSSMEEPALWTGLDRLDPQREDLKTVCQLYNLDCVGYESILLGLFSIWRGDKNIPPGRPKPNEICLGYSRDGFHWHRPERRAFIGVSEKMGDWNWGNVQSAGGCCLVVGDQLYFYHSGRAGSPSKGQTRDTGGSTGLAILRRDGFASLDASQEGGTITTRPVRFAGQYLFVNADVASGELSAEILDDHSEVVPGFAKADCVTLSADKAKQAVTWKTGDLTRAAGKPVRIRFHLKQGKLYAFWVSPDKSGASRGYVAAGGPGFQGALDT